MEWVLIVIVGLAAFYVVARLGPRHTGANHWHDDVDHWARRDVDDMFHRHDSERW